MTVERRPTETDTPTVADRDAALVQDGHISLPDDATHQLPHPARIAKILAGMAGFRRARDRAPIELPSADTLRVARVEATLKEETDPRKIAYLHLTHGIFAGNVEYDAKNPMLIEDLAQVPEVIDATIGEDVFSPEQAENS